MSTSNPLHVLSTYVVTRYLPNLSFSNPPLLLWCHKSIFFMVGWWVLFASFQVQSSQTVPSSALAFYISMDEGGSRKARYGKALEMWLEQRGCLVSVRFGDPIDSFWDLHFRVIPEGNAQAPDLIVSLENANALDSVWLVRKSSETGGMRSIAGERVGLLSRQSEIGYRIPLARLNNMGVTDERVHVTHADFYQGLMVLLLHGDVYAVAAPRLLAQQWQKNNSIAVIDTAEHKYHAGIWINDSSEETARSHQCLSVMASIERSSRRDMKMKLFPEWVNRFVLP